MHISYIYICICIYTHTHTHTHTHIYLCIYTYVWQYRVNRRTSAIWVDEAEAASSLALTSAFRMTYTIQYWLWQYRVKAKAYLCHLCRRSWGGLLPRLDVCQRRPEHRVLDAHQLLERLEWQEARPIEWGLSRVQVLIQRSVRVSVSMIWGVGGYP